VASIEGDFVWLDVAGKRMRMPRAELEPAGSGHGTRDTGHEGKRPIPESRVPSPADRDGSGVAVREVNVIGRRLDEAIEEVEKALDEALVAGARLRVIHGHGTGRLREGIREHLRGHRAVASVRAADAREGGNGATVVELK